MKVRCIRGSGSLVEGNIYTVERESNPFYWLIGNDGDGDCWYKDRFEVVQAENPFPWSEKNSPTSCESAVESVR